MSVSTMNRYRQTNDVSDELSCGELYEIVFQYHSQAESESAIPEVWQILAESSLDAVRKLKSYLKRHQLFYRRDYSILMVSFCGFTYRKFTEPIVAGYRGEVYGSYR